MQLLSLHYRTTNPPTLICEGTQKPKVKNENISPRFETVQQPSKSGKNRPKNQSVRAIASTGFQRPVFGGVSPHNATTNNVQIDVSAFTTLRGNYID